MKIKRRLKDEQHGLVYDNAGAVSSGLYSYMQENIVLPEIGSSKASSYFVPLLYRVSEDGKIYDIAVEVNYPYSYPRGQKLAKSPEFEGEAIRLLQNSGPCVPFSYLNKYVNFETRVLVSFIYHPMYFTAAKNYMVLNPDTKSSFMGDPVLYKNYINPTNGCDGIVTFLVIIEPNGSISNEICLEAQGKTNCKIGLSYLQKLVPWKAATNNGKPIRSQRLITIKTQ